MADFLYVKSDLDQAMRMLSDLDGNKDKMRKRILSGVGIAVKGKVKKAYRSFFHKKSGVLYKSIKSKVTRNGKAAIVFPSAKTNDVKYGYVLAKGGTIKPKKRHGLLSFQIGDKWVKAHSVTLPERDWVEGPARKYLESSELKERLDVLAQKEITKAEKAAQKRAERASAKGVT